MAKRLFIGSMLNPDKCQLIEGLVADLQPQLANLWPQIKLRWVKPEKLHITLLFLGDCDAEKESALKETLPGLFSGTRSIGLSYNAVTVLGADKKRPKAIVLEPSAVPGELHDIGTRLRKNLSHFCQRKDEHPFRPHLTLCRFPHDFRGKPALPAELDLSKFLPLVQSIDKVSLIESHMGDQKNAYEIIADYQLTPP